MYIGRRWEARAVWRVIHIVHITGIIITQVVAEAFIVSRVWGIHRSYKLLLSHVSCLDDILLQCFHHCVIEAELKSKLEIIKVEYYMAMRYVSKILMHIILQPRYLGL